MKNFAWIGLALLVTAGAAFGGIYGARAYFGAGRHAQACEAHRVARCPFCAPSLLEEMGFCSGHGVPEAICTRCRGDLDLVFQAQGDWCAAHGLPESQCEACHPGVLAAFARYDPSRATATECGEHGITRCPFCDPSLLDSMGFCNGHGVPEAVCTRCRDDLEEVYRARQDWCAAHGLPESHCEACNPGTLEQFRNHAPSRGAAK
jgi:cobalt-zinc-cadmium efflux system membrane fusion protein